MMNFTRENFEPNNMPEMIVCCVALLYF